jgi:hypothetical protein
MSEIKLVLPNPIVCHQQPTTAPFLHTVKAVAHGGLHDLSGERLRIPNDAVVKGPSAVHLMNERFDGHRMGLAT